MDQSVVWGNESNSMGVDVQQEKTVRSRYYVAGGSYGHLVYVTGCPYRILGMPYNGKLFLINYSTRVQKDEWCTEGGKTRSCNPNLEIQRH